MFKYYHNPRCKISRQGLSMLQEKGVELEVIEYLRKPPTIKELKTLLVKLNIKPQEIIRTNEKLYQEKFKGKKFTNEEWMKIIIENPVLIERPILEKEYKAIIGRPVENILELL